MPLTLSINKFVILLLASLLVTGVGVVRGQVGIQGQFQQHVALTGTELSFDFSALFKDDSRDAVEPASAVSAAVAEPNAEDPAAKRGSRLIRLPYLDNAALLQAEQDHHAIITAAGRDAQVVYLKGGGPFPHRESLHRNRTEKEDSPLSSASAKSDAAVIIPGPFTFGKQVPVDIDVWRDGEWLEDTYDPQGSLRGTPGNSEMAEEADRLVLKRWRLVIKSPNALSLNLLFDRFRLPPRAELYVKAPHCGDTDSREDASEKRPGQQPFLVLGAFTAAVNNKPDGRFATAPLPGSILILEYFDIGPRGVPSQLELHIKGVVHGFRPLFQPVRTPDGAAGEGPQAGPWQETCAHKGHNTAMALLGISGPCNIDAACPAGAAWRDQIRSVAVFMTSEGSKFCSGAMLNNALQDGKQYFLTAHHCIDDPLSDHRYAMLGFNYENSACAGSLNGSSPVLQSVHGLIPRAKLRHADVALFEVQERIPASYNVYLAGWSAAKAVPPGTVAGIHHPSGDVKKISTSAYPVTADCWTECPRRWHWRVNRWSLGVTEPGSSGSPLFSPEKLIIGQLHGGGSSCDNPTGYDVYGAFHASYSGGQVASQRLINWLNPKLDPRIIAVKGAYLNALRASKQQPNVLLSSQLENFYPAQTNLDNSLLLDNLY
jgi:hypothetical protein